MERSLIDFLETHVAEVEPVERRLAEARWQRACGENPGVAEAEAEAAWTEIYANRRLYARLRSYEADGIGRMASTRRQIHLLRLRCSARQIPSWLEERTAPILHRIASLVDSAWPEARGKTFGAHSWERTFASSSDLALREQLYRSREEALKPLVEDLQRLVGLRNRAARDLEYPSWSSLALDLDDLDATQCIGLAKDVLDATADSFAALKEEIDAQARDTWGVAEGCPPPPWMLPDPDMSRYPGMKPFRFEENLFSQPAPVLTQVLLSGLGLDVSEILARGTLVKKDSPSAQTPFVALDRSGRKFEYVCEYGSDAASTGRLVRIVTKALHHVHLDPKLPFLLREAPHSACVHGLGRLLSELLYAPRFLTDQMGLKKASVSRALHLRHENRRRHRLLQLRSDAVALQFQYFVYQKPGSDLDGLWRRMREVHLGLHLPESWDHAGSWATTPELVLNPVAPARRLIASLYELAVSEGLRDAVGDEDVSGRKEVGDILRDRILSRGNSLSWAALAEKARGKPSDPAGWLRRLARDEDPRRS